MSDDERREWLTTMLWRLGESTIGELCRDDRDKDLVWEMLADGVMVMASDRTIHLLMKEGPI